MSDDRVPTDALRLVRRQYGALLTSFVLVLCVAVACLTTSTAGGRGTSIVICGKPFDIGTPVVLWSDPQGYDAYSELPRWKAAELLPDGTPVRKKRYGDRDGMPAELADEVHTAGWSPERLARFVDQFVVHFDVCGTSRRCFEILQDVRGLSVHFMLDVDGTIYQTLDTKERAWHATIANGRSIGIEIAHIGAYSAPGHPVMRSWYETDAGGLRIKFPGWMKETGIRTPGFVARPATAELFEGEINGDKVWMHDFTREQHAALAKLTAGLARAFPKLRLDVPRDADGRPLNRALSPTEFRSFAGVLGHYHVQANKNDPGPALDWERLLTAARAGLENGVAR